VVVGHLDFIGIAILKAKANSPLIVDVDGVLALPIAAQGMQPVADGDSEVAELLREVNMLQPSYRPSDDVWRQPPGLAREEQVARMLITERLNYDCNASRDTRQPKLTW
jgi:hypothetical protein